MVEFTTQIHRFAEHGDKTGWSYICIPPDIAQQLKPGNKKTFRVKGTLDSFPIRSVAVQPAGDGSFLLAVNASMRKGIGKKHGAILKVSLEADDEVQPVSADLLAGLEDAPRARDRFHALSPGHQRYFSNWIESAKTEPTRTKRVALALNALEQGLDFGQMLRAQKHAR